MTDSPLNLTQHQASDVEAASETVYTRAVEQAVDTRSLGFDLLALATLLLVIITYHMQNPLLLFDTQFGSAFRNATLQPNLALALALCVGALGWLSWRERPLPLLKGIALAALAVYTLHILLAILADVNLFGALFNIPPEIFTARLTDETPRDPLMSAVMASMVLELVAIAAVFVLWQPWSRLAVYGRTGQKQAPALIVAAAVLVLWEVLILIFSIEEFLLPRPSVIGGTMLENYPLLTSIGWNTFQNAFWGFAFGCGGGILVGMISARFIGFSRALLPLAVGLNAVPIIALAPIMNNWFGITNPGSKIAICALLTFFPTLISTVRGLTSIDNLSMELMRSYAASQLQIFTKLRLPSALPYIFSALKVSTTLSMIGAVVSEYFGGSRQGLGYQIRDYAALFQYPEAWSAIIVASLFGILFYLLVSIVERAIMPWHVSFREE
jgi:NitT/TauT family transport system permease protein